MAFTFSKSIMGTNVGSERENAYWLVVSCYIGNTDESHCMLYFQV